MRVRDHALRLLSDYPTALWLRRDGLRHPDVPERFAEGELRPVVILPGVFETWHFLRALATRVSDAGYPVHVLPELGYNAASIPEAADRVLAALTARDLRSVALLAHSKGGLIGKRVLLGDAEGRIDRLIAVATPFGGTRMAQLTVVPALRAFRPADPEIRALAAERGVNSRVTSIYPRFDPHIPGGSALVGAVNIEIPVVGHFRILLQDDTAEAVLAALARD